MSWGGIFRAAWERASSGNRAAAREAAKHPDQAASLMSSGIAHTFQRVQYAAQDLQRMCVADNPTSDAGMQVPSVLRKVMDDIRQGRIAPDRSEKYLRQAATEAVNATALPNATATASAAAQGTGPIQDSGVKAAQEKQHAMQRFCDLKSRLMEQVAAVEGPAESASSGEAAQPGLHPDPQSNQAVAESVRAAFGAIDVAFLAKKRADDPAAPLPPTREMTPGGIQRCHPPRA